MQKVLYPCNVGGLAEHKHIYFLNKYIFILIFMKRYQRYGLDATALWM